VLVLVGSLRESGNECEGGARPFLFILFFLATRTRPSTEMRATCPALRGGAAPPWRARARGFVISDTPPPRRPPTRPPPCVLPGRGGTLARAAPTPAEGGPPRLPAWYASLAAANGLLPYAVAAAAACALAAPPLFAFFSPPWYGPALGFLSFAIGVSLKPSSFADTAAGDPGALAAGTALQWVFKPAAGVAVAAAAARLLAAPPGVGTGLILVSIVSGAQLSAYATFLAAPSAAPLAVLLTAGSTAVGGLATPALAAALLGARLPVDPAAVARSLVEVVALPIALGLLAAARCPGATAAAKPALAALALVDTCLCVGAGLASNAAAVRSPAALGVLLPVLAFHAAGFGAGWAAGRALPPPPPTAPASRRDRARALTLGGGMQSSLLALLLATRLWPGEPLVALVAGVSTVVMTLMGFGLVLVWKW
jgi:BASS family bile acid:Na+ symporter